MTREHGQKVFAGEQGIIVNDLELTALMVVGAAMLDARPLHFSRLRRRVETEFGDSDSSGLNGCGFTQGARVYGPPWAIERIYQWRRERRQESDADWVKRHRMDIELDKLGKKWKNEEEQ